MAPAVLGVCEGGSKSRDGPRGKNRLPHGESERRRALLPSLPLALLAAEEGGSAPCTAPADTDSRQSVSVLVRLDDRRLLIAVAEFQRVARRWAEAHARHTGHALELRHGDEEPAVVESDEDRY